MSNLTEYFRQQYDELWELRGENKTAGFNKWLINRNLAVDSN